MPISVLDELRPADNTPDNMSTGISEDTIPTDTGEYWPICDANISLILLLNKFQEIQPQISK